MFAGSTECGLDFCSNCKGLPERIRFDDDTEEHSVECTDCRTRSTQHTIRERADINWNVEQRSLRRDKQDQTRRIT